MMLILILISHISLSPLINNITIQTVVNLSKRGNHNIQATPTRNSHPTPI